MDIELLSKMVKELILDNDRVTLPGMGAFVAEMVPASFSDRGYTINPPYRRLAFRQGMEQDSLLVDLYASANGVEKEIASRAISEFVQGLAEELKERKTVVLPGLGRLRATRENNFFFVPDEELDIFPEGFGLEPLSLKSHSKPTSFDFTELDVLSKPEEEPVETPVEEPVETLVETPVEEPIEDSVEAPAPAAPEEKRWWLGEEEEDEEEEEARTSVWKKGWFVTLFVILMLILLVAAAFGAFLLLAKYCPDLIDRLLYTKEELDILNRIL